MPILTCPHCGTSRSMPAERLPRQATNARCPQCYQSFPFVPAPAVSEATSQADPEQCLTCPHCGLQRQIPNSRANDPQAQLSCRRCQKTFRLSRGVSTSETGRQASQQLTGIGPLLTKSWEQFCHCGWNLLAIYLLGAVLIFAPLLLASIFLPPLVIGNRLLAWLALVAGGCYGFFGTAWLTASLFQQTLNPQLKVRQAIRLGWQRLDKFAGLLLLLAFLLAGGSLLLIIPGIVFSIWFFFSQYLLAEENIGGMAALEKSHQLVRGRWWAVCMRVLLLLLITTAATSTANQLPMIGGTANFVISLLLLPFALIYYKLIYQDLQRSATPARRAAKPSGRWLYLCVALLGWLLIPGLFFFANDLGFSSNLSIASDAGALFSEYSIAPAGSIDELTTEQDLPPAPVEPQPHKHTDYQQLLQQWPVAEHPAAGLALGPASLALGPFWGSARTPHLWLKLQLAQLPNLDLAPHRSVRVLIDRVTDKSGRDRYDREHSFEAEPFHWVDITSGRGTSDFHSGIRSVYLQPGTSAEQIESIRGRLELRLPIGIETVRLNRNNLGESIQLGDTSLQLQQLEQGRVRFTLQGKRSALLCLRAFDQQGALLRSNGENWQESDKQSHLEQVFSAPIDRLEVFVASDFFTQSYPFEIRR